MDTIPRQDDGMADYYSSREAVKPPQFSPSADGQMTPDKMEQNRVLNTVDNVKKMVIDPISSLEELQELRGQIIESVANKPEFQGGVMENLSKQKEEELYTAEIESAKAALSTVTALDQLKYPEEYLTTAVAKKRYAVNSDRVTMELFSAHDAKKRELYTAEIESAKAALSTVTALDQLEYPEEYLTTAVAKKRYAVNSDRVTMELFDAHRNKKRELKAQ